MRMTQNQNNKKSRTLFLDGSDGIPQIPRRITHREILAYQLYLFLQIASKILFLFTGVLGYIFHGILGSLVSALFGLVIGWLMRQSMGIRGYSLSGHLGKALSYELG